MRHSFHGVLLLLGSAITLTAQTSQQIHLGPMLDQVESSASLTVNGSPFHAELRFGQSVDPGTPAVVVTLGSDGPFGLPVGLTQACRFTSYSRGGIATQYHGDLIVVSDR